MRQAKGSLNCCNLKGLPLRCAVDTVITCYINISFTVGQFLRSVRVASQRTPHSPLVQALLSGCLPSKVYYQLQLLFTDEKKKRC